MTLAMFGPYAMPRPYQPHGQARIEKMRAAQRRRHHPRTIRRKEVTEMDINRMLKELREQREKLDRLIAAAEDYARGGAKRRGRPPAWMQPPKRRGRPPGSKNKTAQAGTHSAAA